MREQTRLCRPVHRCPILARPLSLFAVVAFAIFLAPGAVGADRASGEMELVCTPPIGLDIHLDGIDTGNVVLHLFASPPKSIKTHQRLDVRGKWCNSSDVCQDVRATIEFEHFRLKKEASGSYEIQISDTRKAQGSFKVSRRPQKEPFLCE